MGLAVGEEYSMAIIWVSDKRRTTREKVILKRPRGDSLNWKSSCEVNKTSLQLFFSLSVIFPLPGLLHEVEPFDVLLP